MRGWIALLGLIVLLPALADGVQRRGQREIVPTLGLEQGLVSLETPGLELGLVQASQTVAALEPVGHDGFDFTPADGLERRNGDGFHHLGDLNLRYRTGGEGPWQDASTAAARQPVEALAAEEQMPADAEGQVLAAADLAPTLPADLPLEVRRTWEIVDGRLALRFELRNATEQPVEIGALGIPMVFNNILHDRSLDEAHAVASFHDPYIGNDAGYLQVTRLSGHGPALVVVPLGETPFEAWRPLLDDPTRRGITFEGFHEWMAHSRAWAEDEWSDAEPWNPPTSATLQPGESRSYGVRFLVADTIRGIEETLRDSGRPVAVGVPGYVLPLDLEARLHLRHDAEVASLEVEPEGAMTITPVEVTAGAAPMSRSGPMRLAGTRVPPGPASASEARSPGGATTGQETEPSWRAYDVRGRAWGRARLTVHWDDGIDQTIHYKVIEPAADVVDDLGRFLTTEQWYENPDDPFGRSPSIISYDHDEGRQVTEDNRAWIAGLGDEGGSGSWLAAVMKQLVRPDRQELEKIERFVDGVLWGGLQYAEGERMYGVRKSMFYYEPDELPEGTYSDDVDYGGWSSWDREEAMSVVRSYDYPHVAAAHWVLYRLARNHEGLVTNHPWDWYLERAWQTGVAMARLAPRYAQFGQMDGTVFLLILEDLQREGWTEQAAELEATMRERADLWRSLSYPFGSEMPWDSTGQEEVYGWSKYFGYDEKADVTLNAILAYMPTLPHWGYNGSARRYWDFQYAGKTRRVERQLHHYGSGLNAIPVLSEYRDHPDDLYLLRVGYGGLLGAIANVTQEGFGPSGFHAWPSALRIDGYSGDYGPGFFGHAVNTATYLTHDQELGWLAFGGNLVGGASTMMPPSSDEPVSSEQSVRVKPLDSARSRFYVAPLGLWLTLDAGTFEEVELSGTSITVTLSAATEHTPVARLRIEQPAAVEGVGTVTAEGDFAEERGALLVPLGEGSTEVLLVESATGAEQPRFASARTGRRTLPGPPRRASSRAGPRRQ